MGVEFTVISATDLKKVRTFGPQLYYVVAYVDDRMKAASKVAKDGGSNPTWNWKLSFITKGTETITVEIYSHGSFRNKLVGTSKVSMRDVGNLRNSNTPMFLEVRRPSGKVQGTLSVSMEVGAGPSAGNRLNVTDYTSAGKPNGARVDSSPVYPSTTATYSDSVYPPPRTGGASTAASAGANPSQMYPPPNSGLPGFGDGGTNAAPSYPPPMAFGGGNRHRQKAEEPGMTYPAPEFAELQYARNQYGKQESPQYYPSAQANEPYNYQQAYYAKPSRASRRLPGCAPQTESLADHLQMNSITS